MRDFVYNEEQMLAGKNEISKLASDKKKQFVSTVSSVNKQLIKLIDK